MESKILLGDEAVARGAIDAGLEVAYAYPGTPASEIMEYLQKENGKDKRFKALWSVNEKVAYEQALGVSFAGKRTMVSMKHVGLNVAADPFMSSAIVNVNGGLVVSVADDPGMHSSQNEQDSRYLAEFANIFCFEPSDHQEAYDMTIQAFDISEKMNIPVMIRLVTRISHSRSTISTRKKIKSTSRGFGKDIEWTLLPVYARPLFENLMEKKCQLISLSNQSKFNTLTINKNNRKTGVIASGIAYNYVMENFQNQEETPSILKIGTYPLPQDLIAELLNHVDTIMVFEDGYPFIEKNLSGILGIKGKTIKGKLSGDIPITGELTPKIVRNALQESDLTMEKRSTMKLPSRPPQLCQGCPHTDTITALKKALETYKNPAVFSDIGCYALSALPPLQTGDTCVCMGASVGMAKGGAEAGIHPSVGIIGDSTFAHSGMTPLLEAARHHTKMTLIIVDNAIVAMTGGQPTYASGEFLVQLVAGLGVHQDHIKIIQPLPKNLAKNVSIIKEELAYNGLSVIISVRECIQAIKHAKKRS